MHIITKHDPLTKVFFIENETIYKGQSTHVRHEVHYDKQIKKLCPSTEYGFDFGKGRIHWAAEKLVFETQNQALAYKRKYMFKPVERPTFNKQNKILEKRLTNV